jgi:hypothetical protein
MNFVATFDVDSTLLAPRFDSDQGLWVTDEKSEPNKRVVERFKMLKSAGGRVGIVTTRIEYHNSMDEIRDLCQRAGISPDFVHFTNNKDKWPTLNKVNSNIHFDDDIEELAMAKKNIPTIKAVLVKHPADGNDPMDKIADEII